MDRPIDAASCELTNHFEVTATDGFLSLLEDNGVTLKQVASAAQQQADAHNEEETPLFAGDLERNAAYGQRPAPSPPLDITRSIQPAEIESAGPFLSSPRGSHDKPKVRFRGR